MPQNPTVSILILDFMKAEKVVRNVRSILGQKTDFDFEIIVADNSAAAENADFLRQNLSDDLRVKFQIYEKNLGYPRGNNLAAAAAAGEFLAIVNPDIFWSENSALQKCVDFLRQNTDVGIIGSAQKLGENHFEKTVRRWPHLSVQIFRRTFFRKIPGFKNLVDRDECADVDRTKTQSVDWLQSSFFVLSRKLWDEIGGFDERYFLFLADTEMCWQSWKRGKKVVFFADAEVSADGIRCSDGGFWDFFRNRVVRWHVWDSLKFSAHHLFEKRPR